MGRWRGTPIPRPATAAAPGRRRRLRQPWRGGGGERKCWVRGSPDPSQDPGLAASASVGVLLSGELLVEPRGSWCRPPQMGRPGREPRCLLLLHRLGQQAAFAGGLPVLWVACPSWRALGGCLIRQEEEAGGHPRAPSEGQQLPRLRIELSRRQRSPALQEHIPDQALQALQGVVAQGMATQADKAEIHQEGGAGTLQPAAAEKVRMGA
jgi:hypothetical protein